MPTTNGSRMSFNSHSSRTKTIPAATQKRQRVAGPISVMRACDARSPRLQAPLVGVLVERQAGLRQGALQLLGGAEIFQAQVGAIRLEAAHGDALDRRHSPQPLAHLHPVAKRANRHEDIESILRIAA